MKQHSDQLVAALADPYRLARRRNAAAGVLLAVTALGFRPAGPGPAGDPGPRQPNIVFILTDDLSSNLLPFMPNVRALAKDGVSFSNYFVAASLCCPSRASIFTGQFPHNTGVQTNYPPEGGYDRFNERGDDRHTFALALQRAGYRTAMLGKYLNAYEPRLSGVPSGWDEWDVAGRGYPGFDYHLNRNGGVEFYGREPHNYITDVLAAIAEEFIRQPDRRPFFIEIATFAPHRPFVPAPRDRHRFPGLVAPRSAAFGARPDSAAPAWLKEIPPLRRGDVITINKEFRLRAQSVVAVDSLLGRLRRTLESLGLDRNTYVVFSSDNGFHMGEYSLRPGKMTPFDTDVRVPLIVAGPGVPGGVVRGEIAQNVDLAPTFRDWAGASAPLEPDGRSLVPLLNDEATALAAAARWRRLALIEHHHPGENPADPDAPGLHSANPPSYAALRTPDYLYVEYDDGDVSYYDLDHDPFEIRDRFATLSVARAEQLHEALVANTACRGQAQCWEAERRAP